MQTKLIGIFLVAKVIPLILLCAIAWYQFAVLGDTLKEIAVSDSAASLNESAVKNIERITTDTAQRVAAFLYGRDADIRYVASLPPTEEFFTAFLNNSRRRMIAPGEWVLSADRSSWVRRVPPPPGESGVSTNPENNDMDGFHAIPPNGFEYIDTPIYDEITYLDKNGRELVKVVAKDSTKRHHPMNPEKRDVSRRENTFVKAETYFPALRNLEPGQIYVSDVIGAYVGSNYIGMYTPAVLEKASQDRGYPIPYAPEAQAYSGAENPVGTRFEGIVRWATPVTDAAGEITGYVTLALNHDHIMEFVDHVTPMDERYTELPSAFEGNYAFIWDYQCRSICHPRHHSIVGFDPETGDPQIPWLEESIYDGWQKSGLEKWTDYVRGIPTFHQQSRTKRPAPALTRAGLVGLDGRYLNNAPQCIGWMDLTGTGGSGSFYILWSGLYKLNTAAAIPYYTGQYAPSQANSFSRRGFGFVAVGSGMESFTRPARETEAKLVTSVNENMRSTVAHLVFTTLLLTAAVIFVAVAMAWHISRPIKRMAKHMSRLAIGDFVSEDVTASDCARSDEIGLLARSLNDLTQSRRDELEMADAIASGDYTRSIPLRSEMDMLGRSLNTMIRTNKNTLTQVNDAVVQVGDGAVVVSNVSTSLSRGVETSESVLRDISDMVSSVDRQVQQNAASAAGANKLAIASREAAHRGYESATELSAAMAEIRQSGTKIASVVKLIDDIAFQTNLLALNAAVEAARAGRQGKGFSVVADEVRNLAARSAKAAHETGEMVESMVHLMETGAHLAERSDREFREIVDLATQVAGLFQTIVDASDTQSEAVTQIVESLARIGKVIQTNSSNAQEMAMSATELSRQAEELRQMVSHFRLGAETARRVSALGYSGTKRE
ncbi:MAG: methyl-accepting chemotaxis protein [Planctomycetaceae bacterium]|nr:methyl-accepting chemotaxis protein [Planctomycetaceae bacterium]